MYIVVELQTYENGTVGSLVTQHSTREEAESKFHGVLAAAAISNIPKHAAICITEEGFEVLPPVCYKH